MLLVPQAEEVTLTLIKRLPIHSLTVRNTESWYINHIGPIYHITHLTAADLQCEISILMQMHISMIGQMYGSQRSQLGRKSVIRN